MIAKIENGVVTQWPLGEQIIVSANPNTSFAFPLSDQTLAEYGYAKFAYADPQTYDSEFQEAKEITPILINGVATQQWEIVEKYTAEEKAAYLVKKAEDAKVALQASIVQQTQARLDDFAKTRNYDGILSACTYASSTNTTFQAEGQRAVQLRDDTWQALYNILGQVATQGRVVNGFEDIEGDLPVLSWT